MCAFVPGVARPFGVLEFAVVERINQHRQNTTNRDGPAAPCGYALLVEPGFELSAAPTLSCLMKHLGDDIGTVRIGDDIGTVRIGDDVGDAAE